MNKLNTLMSLLLLGASLMATNAHALPANNTEAVSSPQFLNLTGWMNKGLVVKKRVNLNMDTERSPDPLELRSAEDTYSVNYEFFMKDPDFKCRRPTYYKYFSELLNVKPFQDSRCVSNHKVTLISENAGSGSPMTAREIDPSRIYQIHYLFAGKGKQMMSRWGHAMYRIVLCAPGKAVGPDCLNDYANHVVVSYRANVEDMNIDYVKGMNGAYASQLFLMNMSEVVSEYTKGEFRDMISLPIKMNRDEIKNFTDKLLENYWSYKGRYYFLTNNCATEAMNLLRAAFPKNEKIQTASIVHPLGLYDFLVKIGLTNPELLNNKKEAIKSGYLFQGVTDKLQKSLELFAGDQKISFEDFALKLSPKERKAYYERALASSDEKAKTMANAIRLEEQIQISREQQFAKKIGNALFGKNPMPELKDTVLDEKIIEMKSLYKKLTEASELKPGYGIPLEGEFTVTSAETIKNVLQEIQNNTEELKDLAFKFFPAEVEDMRQTMENRQWILSQLNN
jgi:hypothetical protein